RQQQPFGTGARLLHGGIEGLPFQGVLVGPVQEGGGNGAQGLGQRARQHGFGPFALQLGLAAFLFDGGQGGLQDVGRGGAEGTLAAPVVVGRRCRQGQDGGGLFHCVGRVAEVVFGQRSEERRVGKECRSGGTRDE